MTIYIGVFIKTVPYDELINSAQMNNENRFGYS